MERVSGTHLKPYIAVHNGDEKDAKREMIAQKILLHWNVKLLNWANSIAL